MKLTVTDLLDLIEDSMLAENNHPMYEPDMMCIDTISPESRDLFCYLDGQRAFINSIMKKYMDADDKQAVLDGVEAIARRLDHNARLDWLTLGDDYEVDAEDEEDCDEDDEEEE